MQPAICCYPLYKHNAVATALPGERASALAWTATEMLCAEWLCPLDRGFPTGPHACGTVAIANGVLPLSQGVPPRRPRWHVVLPGMQIGSCPFVELGLGATANLQALRSVSAEGHDLGTVACMWSHRSWQDCTFRVTSLLFVGSHARQTGVLVL
jgi:hypothetical protein